MREFLKRLIKQRKAAMAATRASIEASVDAAEVRALGETLANLKAELEDAEAQLAALDEEGDEGEEGEEGAGGARGLNPMASYRAVAPGAAPRVQVRERLSLGEHFVRSIEGVERGARFSVSAPEYRAASDTIVTGGAAGVLAGLITEFDPNIVQQPRRATVADLFNWSPTTAQAITYYVEQPREGNPSTRAESGAYAQVSYGNPQPKTEALKSIGAFIKESDELLEDLPRLAQEINGRLLYDVSIVEESQLLTGSGTGNNLTGVMSVSGIQTYTSPSLEGNADAILHGATLISTGALLRADGILINPADYEKFQTSKDANRQYYGAGFFGYGYGNSIVEFDAPLWGYRTVVSPAIAEGTVLVGAFRAAATAYRKGGLAVEMTNTEGEDFTNGRVTVRAGERVMLATRKPAGFAKITLATA